MKYAAGDILVTVPGDIDGDRDVDIFDIVRMGIVYGTSIGDSVYEPNSDIDDDGKVNIADPISILSWLFAGGRPLPPPAECGPDPAGDPLDCRQSVCQ